MTPAARRALRILAVVAGLLIVGVAALPYVVSLDAVRGRVLAAAEAALHRKVEAGRLRLEIFTGLGAGAENVVVHNKPGWQTPALLAADRVSVKLAFWPLLSRRIEVRRIVLDGATVTIERDAKGATNVDDFLSASGRPSAGAQPATAAAFLIANAAVSRGRVQVVDRKIVPGETVTTTLDAIDGRVTGLSASSPARFDLAARLLADTGRNLTLRGTFGPPKPGRPLGESVLAASVSAKSVALARLGPYLGEKQEADPGVLSIDATANGAFLGALRLSGNLALAPRENAGSTIPPVAGLLVAELDWPHGALTIEPSPITVAKLPLTLQGRVDDLRTTPRVDLRVATTGEAPLDGIAAVPAIAAALPQGVAVSGKITLAAELTGPVNDLATHASLSAAPIGVASGGTPLLAAASATATLESRGKGPRSGRVTIPAGELKGLHFTDLRADWSLDAGRLVLSPSAEVYGGRLTARVESEPGRPDAESRATVELAGVQGEALVDALTTARNVFSGTLNGQMSLVSRGLSWDALAKTGTGEGRVSIAGADLRTVQLLPEVARVLSSLGRVAGFSIPPGLESTRFDKLATSLHLADGRVSTPDLTLSGRDAVVDASGSLGLDKTLAYEGRVTLQPSLVKSLGKTGAYVADAQGRLALPFRAEGTIAAPKVAIDETALLARAGGAAAGKALGDALGGRNPADLLQQFLKPPAPTPTPR
jgi:AsmA protein